jgi:excisionase family DNA binding protein
MSTAAPEDEIKSIGAHLINFNRALTADEVAALFNIHPNTIYKQARCGDIPSFRIGSSVRFDPKKLAEWYRKQSIG